MAKHDEVAIVGYAGRLPGAGNTDTFWSVLRDNRSTVSWITPDRFPTQAFFHPSSDQSGKSYTFAAGLIDDVWGFDAPAFGMSPREAEQVDPQQRHLLEVTYDALAHAGVKPSSLAGSDTGVYVGASSIDYGTRFIADPSAADVHMMTGNTLSVISNRLSYSLDLHGPSFTVDTACSSSLVALNLATDAIRSGKVDTAIVGGVNLLLSPFSFVGFSRASMLSPTGRCRPFDAAADGYVRAEGVIVLVLRSMSAARKAQNRIHAAIVGSGVGQDGRTTGLSLPSAESQRRLLEQVYGDFAVDPADLAFVEAHGTGTKVGDPLEADALGKALAQRRSQPLPIGSVKSNIGHLEPASGLAGVLKSILALTHGVVPATLHQDTPSPHIPLDDLNLRVIDRNWQMPLRRGASLAGVNSFGFGGTNAHVILRSDDAVVSMVGVRRNDPMRPLLLSAHSADTLAPLAAAYVEHWPSDKRLTGDFLCAAAHSRDALPHRLVVHGGSAEEIKHHVACFAQGETTPSAMTGQALGTDLPIAYLFSGNGSQWAGMGREAWHANARFRDAFKEVDDHFSKVQKWSLAKMLFADDLAPRLRRAAYSQPLLLALQVATVRVLEDLGVAPTATLGHSVGEIAAAWAAGALCLKQAIDVVIARSRHQEGVRGSGGMAALMLGDREARRFLTAVAAPGVDVAALNSWRSVTVSGPVSSITRVVAAAAELRIGARRLDLDYPFHSSLVDPVRAPLLRELQGMKSQAMRKRFVSSVTGGFAEELQLGPEHWWRNVRDPVQFEAAVGCLVQDGLRVFVEIGPKPILSSYVRDMLREANVRGATIESLTESEGESIRDPFERIVSKVFLTGGQVDLHRFVGPPPAAAISLPLYPWRHSKYTVKPTAEAANLFAASAHPVLGQRPRNDAMEWFSTADPALLPWIADHAVGSVPVFPAAGYVDTMLAAAREVHGDGALELRDLDIVRPLVFDGNTSSETLIRLAVETGIVEFFSRSRGGASDWTLNARGIAGRSPIVSHALHLPEGGPGTVIILKPEVYHVARSLGFDYGPTFQRVHHVAVLDAKRAVAALEPNIPAFAACVIDLTALDAGFHALFASESAGVADIPLKRMLPIRFGSVRVFAPGVSASHVSARVIRRSSRSIVLDIDLFDAGGTAIACMREVRLIDAPVTPAANPKALSYRAQVWRLNRPGIQSVVQSPALAQDTPLAKKKVTDAEAMAEAMAEALLLLEAGCLRIAWTGFKARAATPDLRDAAPADDQESDVAWPAFLASALLGHLENNNLIDEKDSIRVPAAECDLPDPGSVVRSIVARHPTMAGEAAGLSHLTEIIDRLIAGDPSVPAELASAHWRHLNVASSQIALLQECVVADVTAAIAACDDGRLLCLLLIGAGHFSVAAALSERFPNLEIIVTDLDVDRLEQGRASLGDDAPRVRCLSWAELEGHTPGVVDIVCAIDALNEVSMVRGATEGLIRLLRPNALLVAGELAPSVFWDVVRGVRPAWWARSATSDFPVGALLTGQEWADELQTTGFAAVTANPVFGQERIGVVIHGRAENTVASGDASAPKVPDFTWDGEATPLSAQLRAAVAARLAAPRGHDLQRRGPASGNPMGEALSAIKADPVNPADGASTGDVVWILDAGDNASDSVAALSTHLDWISVRWRSIAGTTARLWVMLDMGEFDGTASPLDRPLWCALTASMRVVQNEYPGIEVRCIGFAGVRVPGVLDRIVDEMLAPGEEREVFFLQQERLVFRFERGAIPPSAPREEAANTAVRLGIRPAAARGALEWTSGARSTPGSGEVEIRVEATGLNFRDVMWNLRLLPDEALEDGYSGPGLGMECAGTVSVVGPEVEDIAVGDRVVAFVSGAFASHVVAPTFAVSRLPQNLTFEAAATMPVAFLTAYYSLVHLARLGPGETVLIHGGAGAVGLAALQIAKNCGAKVIATAGSEEKRTLLRHLGADLVLNSRTLAFADEIRAVTGGEGIDVVLNSLAGEAMVRSMDCLKPFGRFIELGKRDFYANTHVGLRPFRKNLTYFGVDVDQLIGKHRDLTRRLFADLVQLFASRALVPLPHSVFSGECIADAFHLMQRAGHIGKIVVKPAPRASDTARPTGKFPVDAEGMHIVIGGTRGFGLATAEWLVERGARHVTLASRSGKLSEAALVRTEAMRRHGAAVEVVDVDVADAAALEHCLRVVATRRPIKGIVHAAMAIDDRLVSNMDYEAIETVLRPKIAGAVNLDRLTEDLRLDYFLLYSSATTLFGNPGQLNYVAANSFLEGFARRLWARGRPALAVAWGAIEDAGYLSRHIKTNPGLRKRFGTSLISARQALDGLDWLFDEQGKQLSACCAVARIDWTMARRELPATRAPAFNGVVPYVGSRPTVDPSVNLEMLRGMAVEQAAEVLLDIVVAEIARVLRLPPKEVDRHRPLAEIGMDSLMMLELRTTVEAALQIELPMMGLANGITPTDVARRIAPLVVGESRSEAASGSIVALATSHLVEDAEAAEAKDQQAAVRAVIERSRNLQGPL